MEHIGVAHSERGSGSRQLSPPLVIGIMMLPIVFAWFVLRDGYSARARAISIGWALLSLLIWVVVQLPPHENGSGSSAYRSARTAIAKVPTKAPPAAVAANTAPATNRRDEKRYIDMLDDTVHDLRKEGFIREEDTPQTTWAVAVGTMGNFASLYADASNYDLTEQGRTLRTRFLDEIGALQAKDFPRIRRLHAKALSEKLWKHDIIVEARGAGSSSLLFTGIIFGANRNIQEVMEAVVEDALAVRCKRLEFRAYKGDAITYYDIKPLPDSKVATFAYATRLPSPRPRACGWGVLYPLVMRSLTRSWCPMRTHRRWRISTAAIWRCLRSWR